MKWITIPAAIMAVSLGSSIANAELFNRASRLFDLPAPLATSFEGPKLASESSDATAIPQEVVHYGYHGNAGVRYGHGTGCCQEEISFARSLWSCYCGQKRTRHIPCIASSKCRPARCGVKAKCGVKVDCCKPRFCWPKFDFHWARLHSGHGCHKCGQAKCGGCSKQVRCRKPLWSYKLFSWKSGCCTTGCTDCGMSSYEAMENSKGGEIWSDAEEIKSTLVPPTPEPATNEVSTPPSTMKSASLWSIPKALPGWSRIFGR